MKQPRLNHSQPFLAAREALSRHRLRAALGMAGVVCGVAVALATAAVNDGARRAALASVARLGANTLVIRGRAQARLTVRDAQVAMHLVPYVAAAVPLIQSELPIAGPRGAVTGSVVATTAEYANLRQLALARGRFLRVDEDERGPRVCVLGALVARALFAYEDPTAGAVRIGREWYRVVGVVASGDLDRGVVVPIAALAGRALSLDPDRGIDELRVQVDSDGHLAGVATDVPRVFALVHASHVSDYEATIPSQLVEYRTNTQRLFTIMGSAVGVLLLFVGSIGIMSTMLTAVLERTREIGLRRAVGATRRDILVQFLAESCAIAFSGGLVGIVFGVALSVAIARVAGWAVVLSASRMAATLCVAGGVGIASGAYPAMKAAANDPIKAVMHE